jgi:hypothetical protein
MQWSYMLAVVVALGCGGAEAVDVDAGVRVDAATAADAQPVDAGQPDANRREPVTLEDTGLYRDLASGELADGVVAFEPAFLLWSDGATKRRFAYLPPGAVIDTSDQDFWSYPVGTKLWKEFTRDGVRVETRLLYKTGEGESGWWMMAYAWNEAQTEAIAQPLGAIDVLGTQHDIPSAGQCAKCHLRGPDAALGFTALQLAHAGPGVTLAELVDTGRLSSPPSAPIAVPGDSVERVALGYLHANCGNCHNARSDVKDESPLELWLTLGALDSVTATSTYRSAVGTPPQINIGPEVTALIEPGAPGASAVTVRMGLRTMLGMPPIGSELADDDGVAAVGRWVEALGR